MRAIQRRVSMTAVVGFLLLGASGLVRAQATGTQPAPSGAEKEMSVPKTAEEHSARAAFYLEKAASYRKDVDTHRRMLADYDKSQGNPALQSKSGHELPWVAKMRKHCEGYMKQAEALAAEADAFAQFHRMRADEMKGK